MRFLCFFAALGLSFPALAVTTFTQSPASGIPNPVSSASNVASGGVALSGATIYASQGVTTSANNAIIIPAGLAVTITTEANTSEGETSGILTLTLPPGVTFVTPPTAALLTETTTAGPIGSLQNPAGSFGANQSTVIYHFTTAASTTSEASTIQFITFEIYGASALTTPGNSIQIQAQVSGLVTNAATNTNGVITDTGLNDPLPVAGTIAVAANGVTATASGGPGDTIAIGATTIGTSFNSNDVAAAASASTPTQIANVADLGKVSLTPNSAALNAPAAAAQFTSASNGTLTITGNFASYAGAYLANSGSCTSATPPSSAISGTLSASNIVFNFVPLTGNLRAVCLLSSGSTLLSPTGPMTASFSIGGQSSIVGTLGTSGIVYAGTPFNLTFVFSKTGNYQGYLRLVNTSAQPAALYGIATSDTGAQFAGLITTLAPQSSQTMTDDQAFANIGATAAFPPGTHGVMIVLTPAPALSAAISGVSSGNASGVSVTSLVDNPGGMLTNVY